MKFKLLSLVASLILAYLAFLIPIYAEDSSSSIQSASVYISPSTAATMTSSEDSSSEMLSLMLLGDANVYTQDINFTNPSNKDTEVWIKAEGYDKETGNNFRMDGIKYKIQGSDKKGEVTNSFKKAGVIEKPEQGTKEAPSLNLQLEISSIHNSPNSVANIYFVTLNPDSLLPS